MKKPLVVVRGAGDLATGVIQALKLAGHPLVALETARPTAIRRRVSLCSLLYEENPESGFQVENLLALPAASPRDAFKLSDALRDGCFSVPLLIDPQMAFLRELQPAVLVDAIIAKRNLGLHKGLAPLVVALGPGFEAGQDAHVVIETMRGHHLGRHILKGSALPNTGVPGLVGGESLLRVVHAPGEGLLQVFKDIGQIVQEGETIAKVGEVPVRAAISGLVRGMLPPGFPVKQGMKMADIDPRLSEHDNCFTISDKARALGNSVAVAILAYHPACGRTS